MAVQAKRDVSGLRFGDQEHFIAGQWRGSANDDRMGVINPATEGEIATLAKGGAAEVAAAVDAARSSFDDGQGAWARTPLRERGKFLEGIANDLAKRLEEFGDIECVDAGHSIRLAHKFHAGGGCKYALTIAQQVYRFDNVQGLPLTESPTLSSNYIVREPVGICGLLVSWNGAFVLAVRKVFSALAMGNSVILKPAPDGSLSSVELVRVFEKAGLPSGVLNLVTGGGEAGEALARHPGVDMISFTGSSQTGKRIMELGSGNLKRLLLELGGKSPVIVCDDADLDVAVDGILFGGFMISGQACTAGSRVFVSQARHDELVNRLVDRAKTLVVGDPLDWNTDLGPLVSSMQRERVENYIRSGVNEGAKVVLGGGRPSSQSKGYYIEPTILTGVRNDMCVAREEIFGPVLSVMKYKDLDEAVRCANDTVYGLAATIWTTDYVNAIQISKRLRAGTVWINDHHLNHPLAPMGGFKQSGLGRENGGNLGLEEYTELKHLHIDLSARRDRKIYGIVVSH